MTDKAEKRKLLEEKQRRWMIEREESMHTHSSNQHQPQPSPIAQYNAPLSTGFSQSNYNSSNNGHNYNNNGNGSNYNNNSNNYSSSTDKNVLTAEMTNVIREQITKELRNGHPNHHHRDFNQNNNNGNNYNNNNNNNNQALEEYVLQTEAQSHTCKICFEVMVSPKRTPMILYPCGHTFCKDCMNQHVARGNNNNKPNCPYCR